MSLRFLVKQCTPIDLISKVPGKQYFSFKRGNVVARPANREYFVPDPDVIIRLWKKWLGETISPVEFARLTYTVALAPCLAMELFDRQNKKGPATYFECYIGHLFARSVGVNPTKGGSLPVHGRNVRMTMDFLFNMGKEYRKVHLPVKMSTRERVVQAWAHQRLLDAAYGAGAYRGIMVLFSETKLDSRKLEVVEICVPDQWLAYQSLLAHMDRIYYFDIPGRYKDLTAQYPDVIAIKQFGEFFSERAAVLHS
ncbi:MAG: hypothetical protein HY232_00200 [Acidobacteria bacterium]|nr:hypothetical protein [Acidobacteriota bacterium]